MGGYTDQPSMPLKECYECGVPKPHSDYYLRAGRPQSPCKECRRAYGRQRYSSRTPDERAQDNLGHWARHLVSKYGITLADYERLLAEQGGRCRICRRLPEEAANSHATRLGVDHDKRCCPGKKSCGACVRGLLCTHCNGCVGWYEQYESKIGTYVRNYSNAP